MTCVHVLCKARDHDGAGEPAVTLTTEVIGAENASMQTGIGASDLDPTTLAKELHAGHTLGTTARYWIHRNLPAIARLHFPKRQIRVLDLGCGHGQYYRLLSEAGFEGEYFGLDIAESKLWAERSRAGSALSATFKVWDAHDLVRLGCTFNAVLSVTAFEHFDDDRRVMEGIAHVLEPGGTAIIIVPSPYGNAVWGFGHGHRKYTPARVRRLVAGLPLIVEECVPAGAVASMMVNGAWRTLAVGIGRGLRGLAYLRHGGKRELARRRHPWLRHAVASVQYAHLRYELGRTLHGTINEALYHADARLKVCATQWLFVIRRA